MATQQLTAKQMSHRLPCRLPVQLPEEEWANTFTHGVGFVLSLAGAGVLSLAAFGAEDGFRSFGATVFAGALVLQYLSSMLYHGARTPRAKAFLRILDHAAIYLLIAGTYTPFALVQLRGAGGETLFIIVWIIAIAGILSKLFFFDKVWRLSVPSYVAMGCGVLFFVRPILQTMAPGCILLLLIGGLFYIGGVAFFLWRSLRYNHAIWHLFVMAGGATHYVAVYQYVI